MKRRSPFLWVAFALLAAFSACSPSYNPSSNSMLESALVRIECRDETSVRQSVVQLLRSGRGKDIDVHSDGSFLSITAAFTPEDTPPRRLEQIMEGLNSVSGVLHVEIVENPHPIRQTLYTPPRSR